MISPELLFIEDFDELQRPLFRSGNASSPNLVKTVLLKIFQSMKNQALHIYEQTEMAFPLSIISLQV